MKILRRRAGIALPAVLLIVAAAAWAGRREWGMDLRPRERTFVFPESASSDEAVVGLRSCATIEEAMLFKVMGVVRNLSAEPLRYPTAQVAFINDQGKWLDHGRGWIVPEVLEPRCSGRFVLATRPDPRIVRIAVTLADLDGAPLPADYSRPDPAQGFVQP